MEIKEAQDKIKEFSKARGWENSWDIKDILLNMTEEGGELWSLVKWIGEEKQKEIISQNKEEVEDYLGDVLFLLLKLANQTGTDVETGLRKTLEEYEERMPADKMKEVGHSNKHAGGWDGKYGN